jgi:hypothetical protein
MNARRLRLEYVLEIAECIRFWRERPRNVIVWNPLQEDITKISDKSNSFAIPGS